MDLADQYLAIVGSNIQNLEKLQRDYSNDVGTKSEALEDLQSRVMVKAQEMMRTVATLSSRNEYIGEIRDLPQARFNAGYIYNLDIRPSRRNDRKESRFKVDVTFAGSADPRSLSINLWIRFAD
jgi:hypothetical protein